MLLVGAPHPRFLPVDDHVETSGGMLGCSQCWLTLSGLNRAPTPVVSKGSGCHISNTPLDKLNPGEGNGVHGRDTHGVSTFRQTIVGWAWWPGTFQVRVRLCKDRCHGPTTASRTPMARMMRAALLWPIVLKHRLRSSAKPEWQMLLLWAHSSINCCVYMLHLQVPAGQEASDLLGHELPWRQPYSKADNIMSSPPASALHTKMHMQAPQNAYLKCIP